MRLCDCKDHECYCQGSEYDRAIRITMNLLAKMTNVAVKMMNTLVQIMNAIVPMKNGINCRDSEWQM